MMANENITVDNNSYEKMKTFKYLGSLSTIQNFIHEKTHIIIQSKHLFSLFNLKIRIYKTTT